jgi:KaiC/GvpD/RAD55 family RecA-like ATPase
MTSEDRFREGLANWRAVLASLGDGDLEARATVFDNAAKDAAGYVAGGLPMATAIDALYDLAQAHGLVAHLGEDALQTRIAAAFAEVPRQPKGPGTAPNGPAAGSNGPAHKPNGPAAADLPVVFPFPIDGTKLPRRPWLVPGLLLRRQVTLMVAPPGSGKSLLTLQLAMLCVSGMTSWAGWRPRGRYRVLIINVEEDAEEMSRRLCAAAEVMGLDQVDLQGRVVLAKTASIVVATADSRTKTVTATPMLEQVVRALMTLQIDIVVVDPFAETFAGDENSNSELKWAAVLWREVARRTNAAVMLVHHTKKYAQNMAGDPDASRGGGSLAGVARIVATLFPMTREEATAFEIDPDTHNHYLRFDDAKANLSLMSAAARWFQKQSRSLDNAGDGEPADEVGVLVPFLPPNIFDAMTTDVAKAILDEIEVGAKDDNGGSTGEPFTLRKTKRWAVPVLQQYLQCSEQDGRKILDKWIKNGVLEEADTYVKSAKRRRVGLHVKARPGDLIEVGV